MERLPGVVQSGVEIVDQVFQTGSIFCHGFVELREERFGALAGASDILLDLLGQGFDRGHEGR